MADEIRLKAPTVEQQVVVNISGEDKLEKFASTLDKIASNKNLQKYFKEQKQLIEDVSKAYGNFTKNASKDNALELMKTTNALKALSNVDISSLIPDFKNFSHALENAKNVAGSLDSAFSVSSFKDAFSSFETLKAYGLDLETFFKHFDLDINVANLQENIRIIERELSRTRRELRDTQEELSSKQIELDSFIDGSGLSEQIDKLQRLEDEIERIRKSATREFRDFLELNNFSAWDLDEDGKFSSYFENIKNGTMSAKQAISDFKSEYAYLLQENFNESGGLFNIQQVQEFEGKLESVLVRVEEISRQMNDIVENGVTSRAVQNLSVDDSLSQPQRDLFTNVLKDEEALSSIATVLKKIIDESINLQNVNNKTFNEEQFNQLLILFNKIEFSLSSMKSVFADVGDGEEFSPLLKMIDKIDNSIKNLSTSIKGIGFNMNMNIDVGSDKELEEKIQSKISNALQAYQRLFEHIRDTGAGGSIVNTKFFDFDINQYDTMMGKLTAYQKFIDNMRKEAKEQYGGYDVLFNNTEKKYWSSASASMGQVTRAFNEMKASSDTSPITDLFGKTDLTEVISHLKTIADKLEKISDIASNFKNAFSDGFNIATSVEEINRLTDKVKELEDELSKIKSTVPQTTTGKNLASSKNAEQEKATKKLAEEKRKLRQEEEKLAKSSVNKALKEQTSAWKKIQNIREKIVKSNDGDEISLLQEQKKIYQEQYVNASKILKANSNLYDNTSHIVKLEEIRLETNTKIAKYQAQQAKSALSSASKILSNNQENYTKLSKRDEQTPLYTKALDDYNIAINNLQEKINYLNDNGINTKDDIIELNNLENAVKEASKAITAMSVNEKGTPGVSSEKVFLRIAKLRNTFKGMSRDMRSELAAMEKDFRSMGNSLDVGNAMRDLERFESQLLETKTATHNLWFAVRDKAFYGLASQIGTYFGFNDIIQIARQGFETIKEYDTALTEMNKVSEESISTLKEFQKESFELADSIGTTAQQIQNSTADWMRLGESLEQAKQSAQDANILFNVSEFGSIDEATESLVSMSQAYKELEKGEIIDVVNNLGNNFAISTDGLATALQNSASALKTAQNDFYESAALTTAANTVVQDPDKVGAGLRTIALRLTGTEAAREELAALGEDVDDFVVTTTSKLDQQIKDLTKTQGNFGVSLLDMNGNYRSTYEVLLDIAKVWDKIAEEDLVTGENRQNALLEMMAGKNRSNILASVLQSPEVLEEAYAYALDSEGSAMRENEAYLESIEAHLSQLKNAWDSLWINENNREVITFFLDLAKSILEAVNEFGVLNTLLVGGGGIFAGFQAFKKDGRLKKSSLIFM